MNGCMYHMYHMYITQGEADDSGVESARQIPPVEIIYQSNNSETSSGTLEIETFSPHFGQNKSKQAVKQSSSQAVNHSHQPLMVTS